MAEKASSFELSGKIIDVERKCIFSGVVTVENGRIKEVQERATSLSHSILPGMVDAHVHIESSMLVPAEFARLAVVHGTVATVSDPHEIANVSGVEGVRYMLENAAQVPFHFYFGAPSCVPATQFESAGAEIDVQVVDKLLRMKEIRYLSEMMNFPGVLHGDKAVMEKLRLAKRYGKQIDGHAPGLRGEEARRYIEAGPSTDHECFTAEEALDKLRYGMKIIIREGSAAKNFDALIPLLAKYPDMMMFCSDDKHPNDLIVGHINLLVRRAIHKGIDPFAVLRAATMTPVKHYGLNVGLLRPGDSADFIVVDDLQNFQVRQTYCRGMLVAENGKSLISRSTADVINNFVSRTITPVDITLEAKGEVLRVIEVLDGQLITREAEARALVVDGNVVSNVREDVLKLVVVNRYNNALPAVAFVKNIGLTKGAIASSVAHDSHNVIATGVNDDEICSAVNLIMEQKGGVAAVDGSSRVVLPLPVAGLMSTDDGYKVAGDYEAVDHRAKELGSRLAAPFMTLSFLALLVIPQLKLSDKGLFDGAQFKFVDVFKC